MSQTMIVMSAALGAELVLLLIVALSVAWLRSRAARRRDRAAIQALVARVRQERPQREQAIAEFLGTRLGYQDAALSASTTLLARAELQLLHRFALLYRDRDADLAGRFDGELNAMLDAYHALVASAAAGQGAEVAPPAADDAELEALRRENNRLSEELRITMETMSRMLNEYSTMFAPAAQADGFEPMAPVDDPSVPEGAGPELAAAEGDEDDWEVAAGGPTPRAAADEGDWEVAVEAAGSGGAAEDGDWEVAVDAGEDTGGAALADAVEVRAPEPEPETADPLAEIMRAAANQEKSARGGVEAPGGLDADPARGAPGMAAEEDVDLFDVVVEGAPTTVKTGPGPIAEAPEDDLFDVAEAPRSRSAS